MIHEADFVFFPEQLFDRSQVLKAVSRQLGIPEKEISSYRIVRKSIDARKGVKFNVRLQVATTGDVFPDLRGNFDFYDVSTSKTVTIIGAGPAGYFAALQCIMSGLKPIVFERGKSVDERKFDIAALNTQHILNPESNYAFGEGGAGTYSDGKLYTRSKKRGNVTEVLQLLHYFGADEDILVEAHPHIGTDRLHAIMRNIRNKILDCGGEVHFSSKLTGLKLFNNKVVGVVINGTDEYLCDNLVLATGHSARDIYYMLNSEGVVLREKGFAMGVRVEHPQALIDSIQYKRKERGKFLPAASYSLVKQVDGRGVYSFCMCPGGKIVSALTEDNTIVVNGMSNSKRNSPFANSGIDGIVTCGVRRDIVLDFLRVMPNHPPMVVCAYSPILESEYELFRAGGIVLLDNEAIGRQAADFFLGHGLQNFAAGHFTRKMQNPAPGFDVGRPFAVECVDVGLRRHCLSVLPASQWSV